MSFMNLKNQPKHNDEIKKGLIINEKATNKTDQSVRKVYVFTNASGNSGMALLTSPNLFF